MHSYVRNMAALGAFLLVAPGFAAAQDRLPPDNPVGVIDDTGGGTKLPQVQEQNGISFISGGAGTNEADALKGMSDRFNLKLTASVPTGQYTSPSEIRIADARGSTVLTVKPNGPIFMAKLPSGSYTIHATAEGQTRTEKVTVPAQGIEAITMTWPAAEPPQRAGDAPE